MNTYSTKTAHTVALDDAGLEAAAIAKDQIWDGEGYTIYVFDDNSFVAMSGPLSIRVDADDAASVQAYIAWLGDDAQFDAQRIEEMQAALA